MIVCNSLTQLSISTFLVFRTTSPWNQPVFSRTPVTSSLDGSCRLLILTEIRLSTERPVFPQSELSGMTCFLSRVSWFPARPKLLLNHCDTFLIPSSSAGMLSGAVSCRPSSWSTPSVIHGFSSWLTSFLSILSGHGCISRSIRTNHRIPPAQLLHSSSPPVIFSSTEPQPRVVIFLSFS